MRTLDLQLEKLTCSKDMSNFQNLYIIETLQKLVYYNILMVFPLRIDFLCSTIQNRQNN